MLVDREGEARRSGERLQEFVEILDADIERHCRVDGLGRPFIQRIAICVTIEEPGRTMAAFEGTSAIVRSNGEAQLHFLPDLASAREMARRLVEIYRRNQAWKLRADGQGYNDGLAPLAKSFGIDVAENEAAPPREPPEPARTAAPAVPESAPAAPVTVPARDRSTPEPAARRRDNLLRLARGAEPPPPWQTGEPWPKIERLALYTFIPDGAPSWRSAALSLEVSATNRAGVLLELNEGVEGCGMASLILLENREGDVAFTRLAQFLLGHHELDRALGWGLSWRVRDGVLR